MRLRRGVLGAVVFLLGFAPFATAQDDQADRGGSGKNTARPVLVVDEFVHDFGEVIPGRTLRWTFTLRNVGKADRQIHSVVPG